jgi:hypothetical protein
MFWRSVLEDSNKFKNRNRAIFGCMVLFAFAPWWTDWVGKRVSFPYEVKSTLSLQGWDLAGERRVKCVLLSGDQLHHVGRQI